MSGKDEVRETRCCRGAWGFSKATFGCARGFKGGGRYSTNSRGICLDSSRALNFAAKSRSECLLRRLIVELCLRLRRDGRGLDNVMIDDRVEEESEDEELEEDDPDVALAHREIASSTTAAIAVNLPPSNDESEEDDEDELGAGLDGLGGGSPLKISLSS